MATTTVARSTHHARLFAVSWLSPLPFSNPLSRLQLLRSFTKTPLLLLLHSKDDFWSFLGKILLVISNPSSDPTHLCSCHLPLPHTGLLSCLQGASGLTCASSAQHSRTLPTSCFLRLANPTPPTSLSSHASSLRGFLSTPPPSPV